MQVILGLNYLGPGWVPEGIDACNWIRDQTMYSAFENYVQEFLNRITDYHDIVYILFFTEGAEPCEMNDPSHGKEVASLLRLTLGSLPNRLPSELRSKFQIGYHDYSLINLDYAQGESPIQDPISFDFLSMVGYWLTDLGQYSNHGITAELDRRASHFRNLYSNTPLIIGELGATSCESRGGNDEEQARVEVAIVYYALNSGYGVNLWGWKPCPGEMECDNDVCAGTAITNQDGSSKKTAEVLRSILNPPPTSTPAQTITLTPTPTSSLPTPTPSCSEKALQGDYDCDGAVNLHDFEVWRNDYLEGRTTISFFEYWRRVYFLQNKFSLTF